MTAVDFSGYALPLNTFVSIATDLFGPPAFAGSCCDGVLGREIARVYSYWSTRSDGRGMISKILLAGRYAEEVEVMLRSQKSNDIPDVTVADVWINAFDVNRYVPSISKVDSLGYAVAAGLAMPSF
jgi:Tfp pilus assembly PilM family ATPase